MGGVFDRPAFWVVVLVALVVVAVVLLVRGRKAPAATGGGRAHDRLGLPADYEPPAATLVAGGGIALVVGLLVRLTGVQPFAAIGALAALTGAIALMVGLWRIAKRSDARHKANR